MSKTVHYKGRAIPIAYKDDVENQAKNIFSSLNGERDSWFSSYTEQLTVEYHKQLLLK